MAAETPPKASTETALRVKIDTTRKLLESMKTEIEKALPRHISADQMLRVVMTEVQLNPKILNCTKDSFLKSVMQSCQIGLVPDGVTGRAHLVPYENKRKNIFECKLIIGYRGLLELARRSKELAGIYARCVYQKDTFHYAYGDQPKLTHVETADPDPGEITYAYAVAFLKDGGMPVFEVMSRRQLDAVRDRAAYKDPKGPWYTDPDPMCRKSALRKLCKVLPFSTEVQRAVTIDELNERGLPVPTLTFPEEPLPKANGAPTATAPSAPPAAPTTAEPPKSGSGKLDSFSGKVESADGLRKRIRELVAALGYTDTQSINNLLLDLSMRSEGPYKDSGFDMEGLGKAKSVGLMKEVVTALTEMLKQKQTETQKPTAAPGPGGTLFDESSAPGREPGEDDDPGPQETLGGSQAF